MDGTKIITNCGFGNNISNKAELISRFTASQSTLTINDTSVTKFERNKLVNRVFGNSIKNTFKMIDVNYKNDSTQIGCSQSHIMDMKKISVVTIKEKFIWIKKIIN